MPLTRLTLPACLFALAACGTIENETRGQIEVFGQTYTTITRQFDQNGQIVTTGAVRYQTREYGCNTLLPGDCERRVEQLLDQDTLGRNVVGTGPSTYVIKDPNKPGVRPLTIEF